MPCRARTFARQCGAPHVFCAQRDADSISGATIARKRGRAECRNVPNARARRKWQQRKGGGGINGDTSNKFLVRLDVVHE